VDTVVMGERLDERVVLAGEAPGRGKIRAGAVAGDCNLVDVGHVIWIADVVQDIKSALRSAQGRLEVPFGEGDDCSRRPCVGA
jgi:hypothetical protein